MSLVGIDIGNDSCVVAIAKQRGIQVLSNNEGKYETPSMVSFADNRRRFGSEAKSSSIMNPTSTISQLKHLIGKQFDWVNQEDLKDLPFKTTKDVDGGILIHIRHCEKDYMFKPIHILAMILSHLLQMIQRNDQQPISHCVIGVPSYFTDKERIAYRDAAKVIELKNLQLMNEGTAIALGYSFYKTTDINEPYHVVFVDIGHSDTQVTVVLYKGETMKVIAHASDRNLGGRDFDRVLFSHFAEEFKDSFKIDISGNVRACARLMEACEKVKKVLSCNNDANVSVESLMDNKDLIGSITRNRFAELSAPLLERVWTPCYQALNDAGLSIYQHYSVELVGSGSRIPAISSILEQRFEKPMNQTLNASECVAGGCALQALSLSPNSRVKLHKIKDTIPFDVWYRTYAPNEMEGLLFYKGAKFPNRTTFGFKQMNETLDIDIGIVEYNHFSPRRRYKVGNFSTSTGELLILEANIEIDADGIISLKSATLSNVQYQRTSGHALTTNATKGPPEQLEVTDFFHLQMAQADLTQIKDMETTLINQDKLAEELAQQKRNELGGYILQTKMKLTRGVYQDVVTFSEKEKYLKILDEMENWLEHHDEKHDIYLAMLEELEKLFYPIVKRIIEREENQRALDLLSVRIRDYGDKASKLSDPQDMCQGTRGKLIRNLLQPSNSNPNHLPNTNSNSNTKVYFDIKIGQTIVGKLVIHLFMDVVPKTAKNFLSLCTGEKKGVSYAGSLIHHVVPGQLCLGGAYTKTQQPIYGIPSFPQENFVKKHTRRGMLSMTRDIDAPQMSHATGFNICLQAAPDLDSRYVVFGEITHGMEVLDQIEAVGGTNGITKKKVVIVDCDQLN